ncbi:MAG TPA: L-seryl-tRNA(Sec) selenium transferase [Geminicoccaceae bacterium]|nr:L-seryl-tRNA(Sec) selenium transferase [Geminicoccus sp.]HMU50871.1 L-seryl-tRNA(Sec) selenium transferase [Geminicoccaceae bacterium]
MAADAARLRDLPSVDQVLRTPAGQEATAEFGHLQASAAVRRALDDARRSVRQGGEPPDAASVAADAASALATEARSTARPVLNLTGTVLHTNLGRALLAEVAIEAAAEAMRSAVSLELDLDSGRRGERDDHVRGLLRELTGAEDATVVNNNAAAVLLVLNTFGHGRRSIVSRGELIEIGGAFRMPDVMERAGTVLHEIGTTNRTHLRDYSAALGPETGLILKVHTSNYRVEGFTASVGTRDLVPLARAHGVPLVNDLGSGTLADLGAWGLGREPTVREAVAEGADIVTFSGDKLLGGPQAGFIVGRKDLLGAINRNPMKRALRIDKIRLAALDATLRLYRDPARLAERLPTLRLLARKAEAIEAQAQHLLPLVAAPVAEHFAVEVVACRSQIGSGALPLETLPSAALAFRPLDGGGRALAGLAAALRRLPVPVIGRITDDRLLLDLRCLEDEAALLDSLTALDALA